MRLAIFTDTFLPQVNGVSNTLKRLGIYLEENKIEYLFITPEQKSEELIPYHMESFLSAKFFLYPECRLTFVNPLRLTKKLDDFQPDLIFAMTEFTMGFAALQYARKRRLPFVTNYSTNFTTILKAYKLGGLEKQLEKYLTWFHREARLTLTPSEDSKNTLRKLGIYHSTLFSRGVDVDFFSPCFRNEELRHKWGNRINLLYVGRVSPEKDLDILRDAIEILNPEFGQRIRWIITGDGPMLKELKKTLGDQVIYTGYKKGRELAEIYASSDILTFPSTFETFGNVVLEAFASGIPVVGAKAGGVQHIIEHDYNGYLSRPRDAKDFAQGIREMLNHQELCKTYGENARNYALSKSWNHIFDTLMDDFERIIHQGKEEKNDIA